MRVTNADTPSGGIYRSGVGVTALSPAFITLQLRAYSRCALLPYASHPQVRKRVHAPARGVRLAYAGVRVALAVEMVQLDEPGFLTL